MSIYTSFRKYSSSLAACIFPNMPPASLKNKVVVLLHIEVQIYNHVVLTMEKKKYIYHLIDPPDPPPCNRHTSIIFSEIIIFITLISS